MLPEEQKIPCPAAGKQPSMFETRNNEITLYDFGLIGQGAPSFIQRFSRKGVHLYCRMRQLTRATIHVCNGVPSVEG